MIRPGEASLSAMRREFASNPRLRFGVGVIGVVLFGYLLLVLQDWRSGLREEYASRTAHLYRMQSLSGQEEWLAHAEAAGELRAGLIAQIPEVATAGLAQASVQGWIRDMANAFGEDIRVQTQEPGPVEEGSDIWRVPVVITGRFEPARYVQLLHQVESRPTLVVIEQAHVVNRRNQTFSLTIVAYFRVPGAAPAGGPDAIG